MFRYVVRRIVQGIPTLLGITLLSYALMSAAPGGPVTALLVDPRQTPQKQQLIARQLGLNDSWPVQYLRWLVGDAWIQIDSDGDGTPDRYGTRRGILRGDFGHSFFGNRPVIDLIMERVPATLELGITSLLLGLLLGIPVGVFAAVRRGGWFDNTSRIFAVLVRSIPTFWLGLVLILIFGSALHVLPMGGRCPRTVTGCPPLPQRLNYLICLRLCWVQRELRSIHGSCGRRCWT
jgi:ABC-type dipeptide/oligopeptide/nickel transport system permease component